MRTDSGRGNSQALTVFGADTLAALPEGEITLCIPLLDRSGSMRPNAAAAVDSVNVLIETIRTDARAAHTLFGLITFATDTRIALPLTRATELKKFKDFSPDGNTRLYGTVSETLEMLFAVEKRLAEMKRKVRVIVPVVTDGEDNPDGHRRSRSHEIHAVRAAAENALIRGYELQLYGIEVNAARIAREMGFPDDESHAFSVKRTREGLRQTMLGIARSTIHSPTRGTGYTPAPSPTPR